VPAEACCVPDECLACLLQVVSVNGFAPAVLLPLLLL
jgi:hypothetical protein